MARKANTTEQFIERSKSIHGDKYDYSASVYRNNRTKIKIICRIHGPFEQKPECHCIRGQGCQKCRASVSSVEGFIEKSSSVHNGKYGYSQVEYIDGKTKVKIICPKHGAFWQRPDNHIRGAGCRKCAQDGVVKIIKLTHDEFIKRSKAAHGQRYDYSQAVYVEIFAKVKIGCKEHGIFTQRPTDHFAGRGCPKCQASGGEIKISEVLSNLGIDFIPEKSLKGSGKLRFDFYFVLNNRTFLVEYDGIQHFKQVDYWGFYGSLKEVQRRDALKADFAASNGFILIRIPYTQFANIETILTTEINKYTGLVL